MKKNKKNKKKIRMTMTGVNILRSQAEYAHKLIRILSNEKKEDTKTNTTE